MKKLITIILIVLLLTGCSMDETITEYENQRIFKRVSDEGYGEVLVDKETGVMYWRAYTTKVLTLLVNPDGTPRIWNGDLNNEK